MADSWLCSFDIGGPHWLSTTDMSSGLAGVSCRPVDKADYPSTFEMRPSDLVRVIQWLAALP